MRYLCFFFMLLFFFSCTSPNVEPSYTILSGTIKGSQSDSLYLYNNLNVLERTIPLDENQCFKDTIWGLKGYYFLRQPKMKNIELFLNVAFDLKVLYDKEKEQQVSFEGDGAVENTYLRSRYDAGRKIVQALYKEKEDETKFFTLFDSVDNVYNNTLNKIKGNIDQNFKNFETQRIDLLKRSFLADFKHRVTKYKTTINLSDSFPDPFEGITLLLEDEALLQLSEYLPYVNSYINSLSYQRKNDADLYTWYIQIIDKTLKNPKVKDESMMYWKNTIFPFIFDVEEMEYLTSLMQPLISNPTYKQKLGEQLKKLRKSKPGTSVEPFQLPDQNDNLVSLEDLQGKLVYIDLWATWCGPCKREIPHLEKLQEKFKDKDIYFVSISYNDKKDKWKKMVAEKEMGGIQLFATDIQTPFFQNLDIDAIPRFILLDKEGKIINAKAIRPSNSGILPYLEEYL